MIRWRANCKGVSSYLFAVPFVRAAQGKRLVAEPRFSVVHVPESAVWAKKQPAALANRNGVQHITITITGGLSEL